MDMIRPWLFIGSYRDAANPAYVESQGINSMLLFARPEEYEGINTLYLPVEDMEYTSHRLIKEGLAFILAEKEKGNRILVACSAGISQSTIFCMAALKVTEGLALIDGFEEVTRAHPEALPNRMLWESFCEYFDEETGYVQVFKRAAKIAAGSKKYQKQ